MLTEAPARAAPVDLGDAVRLARLDGYAGGDLARLIAAVEAFDDAYRLIDAERVADAYGQFNR